MAQYKGYKKAASKTKHAPISLKEIPLKDAVDAINKMAVEDPIEAPKFFTTDKIGFESNIEGTWKTEPVEKEPPKKEKEEQQTLPGMRTSTLTGFHHSAEPKDDWIEIETISNGKLVFHKSEREVFEKSHSKCAVLGMYDANHAMKRTVYRDENGEGVLISNKVYLEEKDGERIWTACKQIGLVVKREHTFKAKFNADDEHDVANCAREFFEKCDFSGDLWHVQFLIKIHNSKKYNKISKYHIVNSQTGVAQCTTCSRHFGKEYIKLRSDGSHHCDKCWTVQSLGINVGSHDAKNYPNPIRSYRERRGFNVIEGLVYASGNIDKSPEIRDFGVEVEVEFHKPALVKHDLTRFHMAKRIYEVMGTDFVLVKEDGTLTMNGKYNGDLAYDPDGDKDGRMYAGVEIVTSPCSLAIHRERWWRLGSNKLRYGPKGEHSFLRAWDTETCGFHVHVSRTDLSNTQIGMILRFINHENNKRFIWKMAGRTGNKFCRFLDRKISDAIHPERVVSPEEGNPHNRARRVALNLSNDSTIEFRLFRGTVNPRHIIRNLEFCDALCDFFWPSSRSLKEAEDYSYFIKYVDGNRKRWPFLAEWFAYQKLISLAKIKDGVDINKLTIKPDMEVEGLDYDPDAKQQEENPAPQEIKTMPASKMMNIKGELFTLQPLQVQKLKNKFSAVYTAGPIAEDGEPTDEDLMAELSDLPPQPIPELVGVPVKKKKKKEEAEDAISNF